MPKTRIPLIALIAILLLSLLGSISISNQRTMATLEEVKWSEVDTPDSGKVGGWVLANGSDVRHLTMAIDGTLYCYANPSETNYTLFKSVDGGHSWSYTGQVKDAITGIATASDNADIVYYATSSNVYKSADGGNNFTDLPPNPGGAGSNNITITSLDVARGDNGYTIAVGTRDGNSSQYGGVYILEEKKTYGSWLDTNIGNYDVSTVAFSPDYQGDRQLVAVATDEHNTIVAFRVGDTDWGKVIGNATIDGLAVSTTAIAFPDDYDANTIGSTLFVAINSGSDNGDVYKISEMWAPAISMAIDLDIGYDYNLRSIDVGGLAITGNTSNATMLAGTASGSQVYISADSGINWIKSTKEPTGQSVNGILLAVDYNNSHKAYATTNGTASAFSYTTDGGMTWNQAGLIDTAISDIGDLAVSPNYSQNNTLFLLTFDGIHIEHSLWRSLNGGDSWERILTSTLASADSFDLVKLPPEYDNSSQVVFLVGDSGSNSAIWKSKDNGQTFVRRIAPFTIDIYAVVNDNSLIVGSFDGSNSLIYQTTNSGLAYSTGVVADNHSLESIALSPDYEQDETILLGDTNGGVYWSEDNGHTFEQLGQQIPKGLSPTSVSNISVAFDPEFASNKTVYAVSDTQTTASSKERAFRFIIGRSTSWESLDGNIPVGSTLNQLIVSTNGTLYAVNSQSVNTVRGEGGVERTLNPTYSLGPTFETVIRGLDDNATLTGLWINGNQLWSLDTKNTRLMTYYDSLSSPVTLVLPTDKASGVGSGNITLDWETLSGATKYEWQINYDTDFSSLPANFYGETERSSARSPTLDMATTYYWRVRAIEPVLSSWSDKWSFTTSLGAAVTAPELYSPEAGDSGVPLKPVFQWSAIAGADSYELLVSTEPSFSAPLIVKVGDYALPATAWQSDISLDYSTTYYWRVRASGSSTYSAWSAVGAFTTEPAAISEPPQPISTSSPLPPPPPVTEPSLPQWMIYIAIILLLAIVVLLVTILTVMVRVRRL